MVILQAKTGLRIGEQIPEGSELLLTGKGTTAFTYSVPTARRRAPLQYATPKTIYIQNYDPTTKFFQVHLTPWCMAPHQPSHGRYWEAPRKAATATETHRGMAWACTEPSTSG